ncbi:MAG: formylglycine-generating enzyme family protein [bacterium]|nr:formylglycine-generating enzyme family protein [bacterium]
MYLNLGSGCLLQMVFIPDGKFIMGNNSIKGASPEHEVSVSSFYMSKYTVTNEQWNAVVAEDMRTEEINPDCPIVDVSYEDMLDFCHKMSQFTGRGFNLPSEAEWEYACRAGTVSKYYFGNDSENSCQYLWSYENSDGCNHPVGQLRPNKYGLYDMLGNVWESCLDEWHPNYEGAPDNSVAWRNDFVLQNVARGGSRNIAASHIGSCVRGRGFITNELTGFRVIMHIT